MRPVGPALPSLRGGLAVLLSVRASLLVLLGRPAVPLTPTPPLLELAMTLGRLPVLIARLWSLVQPLVLVGLLLALLVLLALLTLLVLWLSLLVILVVLALLLVFLVLPVVLPVVLALLLVLGLPLLVLLTLVVGLALPSLGLVVLLASLALLGTLFRLELLRATVLSLLRLVGRFVTSLGRLLTDSCEPAILLALVERLSVLLLGLLVVERLALLLWSVRSMPALFVGLLVVVLMHM